MNIVPIIDSHFDELVPQDSQSSIGAFFHDKNYREQICFIPDGFTGIIDGKVIGMAGIAPASPGSGGKMVGHALRCQAVRFPRPAPRLKKS